MRNLGVFLASIFFLGSLSAQAADFQFVLPTGSDYDRPIAGAGTLVQTDDPAYSQYQFLFTDAHVVQGENAWVEVEGKRVPVIASISNADPDKDAAIVMIPRTSLPSAYSYSSSGGLGKAVHRELKSTPELQKQVYCYTHVCTGLAPNAAIWPTVSYQSHTDDVYVYRPAWAADGDKPAMAFSAASATPLGVRVVPTSFSPGWSGSLAFLGDENVSFQGSPIEYDRFYARSKLSNPKAFEELFDQFLKGGRDRQGKNRFRMKNGVYYRDLGDGYTELHFNQSPSGGVPAPAGGVNAPPGLTLEPCYSDESAYPFNGGLLSSTREIVTHLTRDDLALGPDAVLKKFKVDPVLAKDGRPVYGFKFYPDGKRGSSILLAPNAESKYLKDKLEADKSFKGSFEPLFEAPDIAEQIEKKIGGSKEWKSADSAFHASGGASIKTDGDGITIQWTFGSVLGTVGRTDQIEVKLDRQGRQKGHAFPMSVIEVVSKQSGEHYYLNLSKLLSTDLSETYGGRHPSASKPVAMLKSLAGRSEIELTGTGGGASGRWNDIIRADFKSN